MKDHNVEKVIINMTLDFHCNFQLEGEIVHKENILHKKKSQTLTYRQLRILRQVKKRKNQVILLSNLPMLWKEEVKGEVQIKNLN
jgi:hypothetical protein